MTAKSWQSYGQSWQTFHWQVLTFWLYSHDDGLGRPTTCKEETTIMNKLNTRIIRGIGLTSLMMIPLVQSIDPTMLIPTNSGEGPRLVISSNFVGVVDEGQNTEQLKEAGVVITWSATGDQSIPRVIWTSEPVELDDGLVAELVGDISPSALTDIRTTLENQGLLEQSSTFMTPAYAAPIVAVVCSLLVPDPYWNSYYDRVEVGVDQVCTGDVIRHRVEGKLQMHTWWFFHSTMADADSGWRNIQIVSASMARPCTSSDEKNWRTWGHGEAWSSTTHFDGPSAQTDWTSLGCKA